MYSTTAYLYQQKHRVLVPDSGSEYTNRRWQPVYAKRLKITRGVDNVILFEFINQDQRPVNISGSTFTFRLISQDGTETLLAEDLETLNAEFGRAKVTINENQLDNVDSQTANWSIERSSGNLYEPVYVDDHATSRGFVDINDAVYPNFTESRSLNVPDYRVQPIDGPNRVHTGIAQVRSRDLVTFQFDFDQFTGFVKAQGADSQLGPWYDVGDPTEYVNQTARDYINVAGHHEYLRFEINQYGRGASADVITSNGSISDITLSSGGDQYTGGAARVLIDGQGSGAVASATVANGSVTGVTVTDGGSGYENTPTVEFDLGEITQIVYR